MLMRAFDGMQVDRWPYDTEGTETIFAESFLNPSNGPEPSNPHRPTYKETVFSFSYGFVKVIGFNNNYWYSNRQEVVGGSPEGYIMDDQLAADRSCQRHGQPDTSLGETTNPRGDVLGQDSTLLRS